jgi:hypothetical protein
MRDVSPRQPEHARVARERTVGEPRQLPIEAGRQIGANLVYLLLDEMIVVEQPFGGRRYRAAFADRSSDRAIGGEQRGLIVL